jgi:hypothetical protein
MSGRSKLGVAAALIVAASALGAFLVFLLRQGLVRASLWATLLVLPLTVIIAVAGAWAAVLAARALHDGQERTERSPAAGAAFRPDISRSGSIYQTKTGGPAIAHTGVGDIISSRPETAESPDESA